MMAQEMLWLRRVLLFMQGRAQPREAIPEECRNGELHGHQILAPRPRWHCCW